jgi:hypothetical protein
MVASPWLESFICLPLALTTTFCGLADSIERFAGNAGIDAGMGGPRAGACPSESD